VTRANGAHPPDPLDELDDVIAELEGSGWEEEITETQIIVQPGATVHVDQTGRHAALTTNNIPTKPDNPAPDSQSPSKVSPVTVVFVAVRKMPPWGVVLVALAGIAAYVVLKR
jgi:hypothetical protein